MHTAGSTRRQQTCRNVGTRARITQRKAHVLFRGQVRAQLCTETCLLQRTPRQRRLVGNNGAGLEALVQHHRVQKPWWHTAIAVPYRFACVVEPKDKDEILAGLKEVPQEATQETEHLAHAKPPAVTCACVVCACMQASTPVGMLGNNPVPCLRVGHAGQFVTQCAVSSNITMTLNPRDITHLPTHQSHTTYALPRE